MGCLIWLPLPYHLELEISTVNSIQLWKEIEKVLKSFRDSRRINNHRSTIKNQEKSLLIPKIVMAQYLQQQGGLSRASISPLNL